MRNCFRIAVLTFAVTTLAGAWRLSAVEPAGEQAATASVEVERPAKSERSTPAPVDFDTEIVPIFTKAGCNAGACHGSAAGRGNFHLSLFGGRPQDDYEAVVREFGGRRVNLAQPAMSLVLQKPTGMMNHGGEVRLEWDGEAAALLERWIAEGARRLSRTMLESFEVTPASVIVDEKQPNVGLQAFATFSDGTRRDVTKWTVFTPTDPAAVEINNADSGHADGEPSMEAAVLRPGQHIVIARYLDRVVPVELLQPLADKAVNLAWQDAANTVDRFVLKKLEALRLSPSPAADDVTFIRRATLDLTGRLPTLEQITEFKIACASGDSRAARTAYVDQLLASDAFNEYWTYRLSKLLRIRSAPRDTQGAAAFADWVKQQVGDSRPLNEVAEEMLLARGNTHEIGPANFYRVSADPRLQAEYASELLMGVRLRCANCHNHPLDRWTQDDYHGLAAIFAKVKPGRVIGDNDRGEVIHPATGEPAVMRLPGGLDELDQAADGREKFAEWLTADANPYFARAWVNRMWKSLMGRGLVESTDDLRATNPATHPELLDALTDDFIANGFDLRHMLRLIATSDTYAAGPAPPNADATSLAFYVHATPKPLEAEVLADAVSDVTDVWTSYGEYAAGTRAVTIYDGAVDAPALNLLGRCPRDESSETIDVAAQRGLASKLHLLNGEWVNQRLVNPNGLLGVMLSRDASNGEIVEEFYLRAFARKPTAAEAEFWHNALRSSGEDDRQAVLEDFAWSLLNSQAFMHNY